MTRALQLLAMLVVSATLQAQEWTPAHIEGISEYPRLAWIGQVKGDVLIKCTLGNDGSVVNVEALSGTGLLKEQALQNALRWKFRRVAPARAHGDNFITLTYQYRLDDKQQDRQTASFSVDLPAIVHITAGQPPAMID